MSCKLALIAAASLALCACGAVNKNIGQEDLTFGESAKYDAAMQTINPAPVYAPDGAQPGANGDKGAQAVKRYRSDQVKALVTVQTTGGGSGGGSSGSTPH